MKRSGIYRIIHNASGRFYIGSATHLAYRWGEHKRHLKQGTHHNKKLQRAWKKYGEDAFVFEIIEYVEDEKQLVEREQFYLDTFHPFYNIAPKAGSMLGYRHTPEAREGFSRRMMGTQIRKGKPHPPETLELYSRQRKGKQTTLGRKHTDATKAKMSASQRNRPPVGEEARAHMSISHRGKKHTEESKQKVSLAKMGNTARLGQHPTEETRQKLSKSMMGNTNALGRKCSELTRERISKGNVVAHARRKQQAAERLQKAREAHV